MNKKKIIAGILALTLTAGAVTLPVSEKAADFGGIVCVAVDYKYGDYTYKQNGNGTVEITAYSGMGSDVTVPEKINNLTVTGIGGNAFADNIKILSVTLPYSIKTIDFNAFKNCINMKSVTLQNGITSIGTGAFQRSGIESIEIPDSVQTIYSQAFSGCSNLKKVTIGNKCTEIGSNAFLNCGNLKNVTIPDSVSKIGDYALGFESVDYFTNNITSGFSISCYKGSAGEKYAKDNKIPYKLNEHSYVKRITKQPTCSSTGIMTLTCACGKTVTQVIPTTQHSYGSWRVTKKATCTKKGERQRVCASCGAIQKQTIKATGHKLKKVKVVKPTLKSKGYTLYKCSGCGAVIKKNYVSKLVSLKNKTVKVKVSSKSCTGKQIKPKVKVTYGKKVLKSGKDYTVKYGKNKAVGKGTVIITGKGRYAGKIKKTFKILPAKTSAKLSTSKGKIKVTLKKAKGAKKYQIQISANRKFKGAKKITTSSVKKTLKGKSKKVYYVRVRSVNGKYVSSWSAVKKIKVK